MQINEQFADITDSDIELKPVFYIRTSCRKQSVSIK